MSYLSDSGPMYGSGAKFHKRSHDKKKKSQKQNSGVKYYHEEPSTLTLKDIADKTIININRLGVQTFALSPFSQYYEDWLVSLRQVISEFESNPIVKVDDVFVKERTKFLADIQIVLSEKSLAESNLSVGAKELQDINQQLTDSDRGYAEKNRELNNKRNAETQRLTNKKRALEDSITSQEAIRISVFKFKAKREAAEKLEQTQNELQAVKNDLEVTLHNLILEQEKLRESYQKQKQELTERYHLLTAELEKLETDTSIEARKEVCIQLSTAVNELVQRLPPTTPS